MNDNIETATPVISQDQVIVDLQETIKALRKDLRDERKISEKNRQDCRLYRDKAERCEDFRIAYEETQLRINNLTEQIKKIEEDLLVAQGSIDGAIEKQLSAENDIAFLQEKMRIKDGLFKQLRGYFISRPQYLEKRNVFLLEANEISSILSMIAIGLSAKTRIDT